MASPRMMPFPVLSWRWRVATAHSGIAYGAQLAWSGNHAQMIEWLDDGRYLWQMGEWLAPGEMILAPGESLTSPDLACNLLPPRVGAAYRAISMPPSASP